jgi:hypothetical protein
MACAGCGREIVVLDTLVDDRSDACVAPVATPGCLPPAAGCSQSSECCSGRCEPGGLCGTACSDSGAEATIP